MTAPDLVGAERYAQKRAEALGYEWGVLPSGEVIPFYTMNDAHSPRPRGVDIWTHTATHPDWMDCYVVFIPGEEMAVCDDRT